MTMKANCTLFGILLLGVIQVIDADDTSTTTTTKAMTDVSSYFDDDIDRIFTNEHPLLWKPLGERDVVDLCPSWKTVSGSPLVTRGQYSPKDEQLMSKGLEKMMNFIICDDRGVKGYVHAKPCLENTDVQNLILKCYEQFNEYISDVPYNSLKGDDDRIHQHCHVFKTYQECRFRVFQNNCSQDVGDWANEVFVKYYDEYMENVHCDIDGGLTTKQIIFIALGCVGGLLLLLCLKCCTYNLCKSSTTEGKQHLAKMTMLSKKKQEEANKFQGQDNKGLTKPKDIENGKETNKKNDYYNTQELNNNEENERKSIDNLRNSREDLRLGGYDRDDYRYSRDPVGDYRDDRDRRDPYSERSRDYRHSPRNYRAHGPTSYPGVTRPTGYEKMFNNRFPQISSPASPLNYDRHLRPSNYYRRY